MDTNFLMIPAQYRIDVFEGIKRLVNEPYQLCIFSQSKDELGKIAPGKGKHSQAAKAALELIKQKNLKTLQISSNESYIDSIILEHASEKDIVCTQDKALKRQLLQKMPKIRIIELQRNNLRMR